MWRTLRDAGRPWPVLSEDDVLDYMVMEAVAVKVRHEEAEAQKKAEREAWKKDKSGLEQFRS
jgi:hypothetical protein